MSLLQEFLSEIAPYVVVVGSFARREERDESDIDCFLRSRPVEEVDLEIGNDTYMPEILQIIDRYDLSDHTDSVLVGHIAVERSAGIERMVEISSHYRIPSEVQPFYRSVEGVKMMCAVDDKAARVDECYDAIVWDDDLCDTVIRFPLPPFEAACSEKIEAQNDR